MTLVAARRVVHRGLALGASLLLFGCGEEGVTPVCPPAAALYDIRVSQARESQAVKEQRAAAVEAGCATPVPSTAPESQAGAPSQ